MRHDVRGQGLLGLAFWQRQDERAKQQTRARPLQGELAEALQGNAPAPASRERTADEQREERCNKRGTVASRIQTQFGKTWPVCGAETAAERTTRSSCALEPFKARIRSTTSIHCRHLSHALCAAAYGFRPASVQACPNVSQAKFSHLCLFLQSSLDPVHGH